MTIPQEQHQIKIASLVCMALFSLSFVFSIVGFFLSRKSNNKTFFRIFFVETLLISLFEFGSGVVVYLDSLKPKSIELEVAQRCINNFSLVFQFSLILTIAYWWRATCSKIKEFSCLNFNRLRTKRAIYISIVLSLLIMWIVASSCLVGYLIMTGKTSEMVLNIFDMLLQISIFAACIVQMIEGRRLSSLLSAYQNLLGFKANRCKFNLVYIVAFSLNMIRSIMQMTIICFFFAQKRDPSPVENHALAYYVLYMILEFAPILLYLFSVEITSRSQSQSQDNTDAKSSSSRNSQLVSEMIRRMEF